LGGRDDQDVVVAGRALGRLAAGRQPAVDPVDQPAGGALAQRRGVEALQLDQALDVVQADVDLLGPVGQVGRAPLAEHGQQHDHGDQQDDQQRREPQHGLRAEAQAVRGGTLTAPGGLR
jgi:hypothetical protein